MRIVYLPFFLLMTSLVHAEDIQLSSQKALFDFTFEELTLHEFSDEKMGLMGGSLLFQIEQYPWLSIGPAAYGTVTGSRGGFITLGIASKAQVELFDELFGHAGLFVGAGGGHGGYQLQGGGLMLREHIGLAWHGGIGNLGLGISRIDFPNGHVASTQLYSSYAIEFESLIAKGWLESSQEGDAGWGQANKHQFSMVYRQYDVPNGVKNSAGGAQFHSIGLVGVEWESELNDWSYVSIESEGALTGQSNGYMQILLGAGLHYNLGKNIKFKLSASAGVAGGGSVDTGGGLLTDITAGLETRIWDHILLGLEAGWVDAVVADFKARSYALKLSQSFATPKVNSGEYVLLSQLSDYNVEHMRVRFVHQSYFEQGKGGQSWRTHHANSDVNLMGFQNDFFFNENFFITGQGIAAYEGQAGGYMTGLLGMGVRYPTGEAWALEAESLVGAAGGGGLAVGGGLVWQVNAGISYAINQDYNVLIQVGRMDAPKGGFAANVLSVSAAYSFSLFMK